VRLPEKKGPRPPKILRPALRSAGRVCHWLGDFVIRTRDVGTASGLLGLASTRPHYNIALRPNSESGHGILIVFTLCHQPNWPMLAFAPAMQLPLLLTFSLHCQCASLIDLSSVMTPVRRNLLWPSCTLLIDQAARRSYTTA
jgi:hypothetical protein